MAICLGVDDATVRDPTMHKQKRATLCNVVALRLTLEEAEDSHLLVEDKRRLGEFRPQIIYRR